MHSDLHQHQDHEGLGFVHQGGIIAEKKVQLQVVLCDEVRLLSRGIHAALSADQFAVHSQHKLSSCPYETYRSF